MATNYSQAGQTINYTNGGGSTIASGSVVVIGALVGVAIAAIEVGEVGAVAIEGVWTVPKATGTALGQGQSVDYDVSASAFTAIGTPASGDLVGCATVIEAAASADTTVQVKLNVRGANVTA